MGDEGEPLGVADLAIDGPGAEETCLAGVGQDVLQEGGGGDPPVGARHRPPVSLAR